LIYINKSYLIPDCFDHKMEVKMKSNPLLHDEGFTMIELIAVIIIIGILSSTAVPKFINMSAEAYRARCQANQGAIASAVALNYAKAVLDDPSQAEWMSTVTIDEVEADWFATGVVPVCPTTGEYSLNNGNVVCSVPDHNWNP